MTRRKILRWVGWVSWGLFVRWTLPIIDFVRGDSAKAKSSPSVYYIDALSGNDRNAGTSPMVPWKTIRKVNSMVFKAGDHILFKRGQVFRSEFLSPIVGGSKNLPITFSAYGTGSRPIITNAMVIKQFKMVSRNIWKTHFKDSVRESFEVRLARNRTTKHILRGRRYAKNQLRNTGDFYYDKSNSQLFVFSETNPSGNIEIPRGHQYDAIVVLNRSWLKFQDLHFDLANRFCVQIRASHQILRRCLISNGADGGLHTIGKHVDDCLFESNEIYGCGGSGIMVNGPKVSRDNWVIRDNHVHHNCLDFISGRKGMHNYTAGIKVFCLGNGRKLVIERNKVHHNGNVHQQNPGLTKGVGIWVDTWPNGGAVVRYNRVFQNVHCGIKIELTTHQRVYCNIVTGNGTGKKWTNRNTGRGGILCSRGAHENLICHNTVVGNFGAQIGLQGPLTDIGGANTKFSNNNIIKNNIALSLHAEGTALKVFGWKLEDYKGNVISHNCFGAPKKSFIVWGMQPKPREFDTYDSFERTYVKDTKMSSTLSIPVVPEFVDSERGDFHLLPVSKLRGKGEYIPEISHDFDGVPFNSTPTIGVYQ